MEDLYKILGVEKNANETEIKRAYRKLAHQYHPDKGAGGDEKKFKQVTEAYEILSDKQKRAQYDQFGSRGKGPWAPGGGAGFGGFDFSGFENVNFDFSGGGFGEIFDTFFGGGGRARKPKGPQRGNDIETVIQLTFEEAVFGASKEIEVTRYETCDRCGGKGAEPDTSIVECKECDGTGQQVRLQRTPLGQIQTSAVCAACQGEGRIPEKKCKTCRGEGRSAKTGPIKVKVPAGIHDKAALRLSGKGEAGHRGGPYGDLFVHISITPSREFERDGNDIHTTVHIHALQAILGDEIPVRTIHGDVTVKIPAGTESGKMFRLSEKGVQKVNALSKGDHLVTIVVDIPKKLSKKERELYEELAREAGLSIHPQGKGFFS